MSCFINDINRLKHDISLLKYFITNIFNIFMFSKPLQLFLPPFLYILFDVMVSDLFNVYFNSWTWFNKENPSTLFCFIFKNLYHYLHFSVFLALYPQIYLNLFFPLKFLVFLSLLKMSL